jgi:hypothetical protein
MIMGVESLASLASVVGNEYWKQSVTYERDRSYWRIVCLRANIYLGAFLPTIKWLMIHSWLVCR